MLKCVGIKEHFTKYLLTFAYMIHKWGNLVAYFSKQRTLDHKFPVRIPGWDDPFQMLDSLPFTTWKDVCELCGTIENTLGVGKGAEGGGGLLSSSPTARLSRNSISRDLRFRSKKKSANQLVLKQETAFTLQDLLVIVMNRYWNN